MLRFARVRERASSEHAAAGCNESTQPAAASVDSSRAAPLILCAAAVADVCRRQLNVIFITLNPKTGPSVSFLLFPPFSSFFLLFHPFSSFFILFHTFSSFFLLFPPDSRLSVGLSVCRSVCLSVCPSVCLSVCLFSFFFFFFPGRSKSVFFWASIVSRFPD